MYQQQQQQGYSHHSLFGNTNAKHNRQSSYSSTSSAFAIPHVHAGNSGISTEDLVDGLQQSMASMDPAHHHHHSSHRQPSYGPRASSAASSASSSSNNGNAHPGGVSTSSTTAKPFEIARSPTFSWHGYRPGSSGQNSVSNYALDAFSSSTTTTTGPPNLTRHVSSPSSFLAAAAAAHNPVQQQQHSFFARPDGDLPSGMETPRSPLELFPSPSVGSSLQLHPDPTPSITGNNVYPFANINGSHESISNLDGRLSSFHRHQAHAQLNSYSSAFSPSSFLVNGLNSPSSTSLNPSQAFPTQHSASKQQHTAPQTKSPPLFDVGGANDTLQQGLNANNKRPGSTDSGMNVERANVGRKSTESPNEDTNAKGQQPQQRGRSQGRTPASGKAPSASRSSRSRTRRPSYSRTISPAGSMRTNAGGGVSQTLPSYSTMTDQNGFQQQQPGPSANETANVSTSNTSKTKDQTTYPNPYAPQLSPYMPGYPSLPNNNIDAALASKPNSTTFEQHIYGASAPSATSAGFDFMKIREQQALALAQARIQAQTAGMATQRPGSANTAINTFDLFVPQQSGESGQQQRASDASTFAPSSLDTVGAGNKTTNMDMLNSSASYTGPLPLPHQEGFRSSGAKSKQSSELTGAEDQDDGDLESSTRG